MHPWSAMERFGFVQGVGSWCERVLTARGCLTLRSPHYDQNLNVTCAQSARKAAAEQRAEDEKRQFQKLIAFFRDSGSSFKETKASVRKAEETRLKLEQDLEVCTLCVGVRG